MHNSHIALTLDQRQKVIEVLNKLLADCVDLSVQAKLAHWNVRGPHFYQLHLLFDKVAGQILNASDELAERIGQLGGVASNNIQAIAATTSLGQFDTTISKDMQIVAMLVQGMSGFANHCRKHIDTVDELGDKVSADLLTRITGETDENLWFVESHLN